MLFSRKSEPPAANENPFLSIAIPALVTFYNYLKRIMCMACLSVIFQSYFPLTSLEVFIAVVICF